MLDDPVPLRRPVCCGAAARGGSGAWRSCSGTPQFAGTFTFAYTRDSP
jgi:hypothetical protein